MKKIVIVITLFWTPLCLAQNYQINWYVIGSGGGHSQSSGYQIDGTIGQPIVGSSSSSIYIVDGGFWAGGAQGGGCSYVVGDVNGSNTFNGLDVTYAVNYFRGSGNPPTYSCECTSGNTWYVTGDVNNSCSFNGLDVTYMVNYFKGGNTPMPCDDCPPARLAPPASTVQQGEHQF